MNNIIIYGLGAVGLPLALSYASNNFKVIGIDINKTLVNDLNKGQVNMTEEDNGKLLKEILIDCQKRGLFEAKTKLTDNLKGNSDFIVMVGIGVKKNKLDLFPITSCLEEIGKNLKKGDLVLIRSTVYPGFTEDLALPILEKHSKLKCGVDFMLAYASERMQEGKAFEELRTMDIVIGGVNKKSLERAINLLSLISKGNFHVGNIKEVETSKILENLQRDFNIAFANEVSYFLASKGIYPREVIKLANTHKRVNILKPGPGVGGHCIPLAYYYLAHISSKKSDLSLSFKARKFNERIPNMVFSIIKDRFSSMQNKDFKVSILGLAMKDFSSSYRLSPVYKLKQLLINEGFSAISYDPLIHSGLGIEASNLEDCLTDADVVVVGAIQKEFLTLTPRSLKKMVKKEALVMDLKGLFNKEDLIAEGFKTFSL